MIGIRAAQDVDIVGILDHVGELCTVLCQASSDHHHPVAAQGAVLLEEQLEGARVLLLHPREDLGQRGSGVVGVGEIWKLARELWRKQDPGHMRSIAPQQTSVQRSSALAST